MHQTFKRLGRSERSSANRFPGLYRLIGIIKAFLGVFIRFRSDKPMQPDNAQVKTDNISAMSCVIRRHSFPGLQVPRYFRALILSKEMQSWRKRLRWRSADRIRLKILIQVCPRVFLWREAPGRRGPPLALFTEIAVVRMQE